MQYFPTKMSRSLSADDDLNTTTGTNQMLNTLYINIIIFSALVLIFECSRGIKSLYLNRLLVRKYVDSNRVPAEPSICPFSWVFILLSISEDEVCRMAGYVLQCNNCQFFLPHFHVLFLDWTRTCYYDSLLFACEWGCCYPFAG